MYCSWWWSWWYGAQYLQHLNDLQGWSNSLAQRPPKSPLFFLLDQIIQLPSERFVCAYCGDAFHRNWPQLMTCLHTKRRTCTCFKIPKDILSKAPQQDKSWWDCAWSACSTLDQVPHHLWYLLEQWAPKKRKPIQNSTWKKKIFPGYLDCDLWRYSLAT